MKSHIANPIQSRAFLAETINILSRERPSAVQTEGRPANFQRSKLSDARCAGHELPMQSSGVF
jgi:hypothetical protein